MRPVLCLITDRRLWGETWRESIPAQVAAAARQGVSLVQVRERDLDGGELFTLVARCVEAVRGTSTRVIVNERLDVALTTGAHGVHLRSDSMPASRVRAQCPRPFLIGRSIHSAEESAAADVAVLDYLVFGTVFETPSKPGRATAGLDALRTVAASTTLPVLAIGGVTRERIPDVLNTGAAGVAAIRLFAARGA